MVGVDIDSERTGNRVVTGVQSLQTTHCVLIMEQPPLAVDDAAPRWRVSVALTLRDSALGPGLLEAMLPAVVVGPILHRRQIVAIAYYPSYVLRWEWWFESDAGRARAQVWLHPGVSAHKKVGIWVLPTMQVEP